MRGWISLQKQIRNHWLWDDPKYLKAWLDMLMMANYSEVKKPYKDQIVTIKRGEFPSSYRKLGERWGMAKNTVVKFMNRLKADTMIDTHTDFGFTLVKIMNYEKYQSQEGTVTDTVGMTVSDTPAMTVSDTTIIKDNKINKTNKKKGDAKKASPPTLKDRQLKFVEQIKKVGKEQGLPEVEQRKFNNHWGATNQGGKKMRWEMEKVFDMKRRMATWKMNMTAFSWDKDAQVKAPEIQKEIKKVKYICYGCDKVKEVQGEITSNDAFCECGDQFMKPYEYNTMKAKDNPSKNSLQGENPSFLSGNPQSKEKEIKESRGEVLMSDQQILEKLGYAV